MLTRSTQVGEFYYMGPPQIEPQGPHIPTNFLNMLIFDEESDKHVVIEWDDAVRATCCKSDSLKDVKLAESSLNIELGTDGTSRLPKFHEIATQWSNLNNGKLRNNTKPRDFDEWIESYREMKGIEIYIAVCRPFIEHLMHSAVLAVSGRDTGATLFGPADMQISANTQVKTIEGHYTGHFKAVVTNPKNVLVMRDIACAGYMAGCNTQWFGKDKATGWTTTDDEAGHTQQLASISNAIMSRLAFEDDVHSTYPSMLAFPISKEQMANADTVLSLGSRLLPWEVMGYSSRHTSFPGGHDAFNRYSTLMNLKSIQFGEDMKAQENMEYISQGSTNNSLCFTGPHRKYNTFTKSFYELVPGQGHFGPDAIPGVCFNNSNPFPFASSTFQTTSTPASPFHVAGRQVASWGERVSQDGSGRNGVSRARGTGADGVSKAIDAERTFACRGRRGKRRHGMCMRVCEYVSM